MFEPKDVKVGDELMIIIEAVAPTQEQASTICGFAVVQCCTLDMMDVLHCW